MISKKNGWGNKSWKRKGKAALEDVKQQEEDTGEKWTETWLRELSDEDVTNKCLRQPSEQISSPIQSITNQQTNFCSCSLCEVFKSWLWVDSPAYSNMKQFCSSLFKGDIAGGKF